MEGNYWQNYNGTDTNGDGIGDTPYVIDADNVDCCLLCGGTVALTVDPKINSQAEK
jgi:nitrous oxidase accessory protein NosD